MIVPKQACNVTEELSEHTVLQFVEISFSKESFSAYPYRSDTLPHINLFRISTFTHTEIS